MARYPLAFDLETTGLLKPDACELHYQPFITEIYICEFDWNGDIISEFETFVKPLLPIPENVTKITGITNDHVKDAPRFIEIVDELAEFVLGHDAIFAHNCSYDINVLRFELARHDLQYRFPWPPNQICTVEATKAIKNRRMTLSELYKMATGCDLQNSHRAGNDVRGMVEAIVKLRAEGLV